MMMMMTWTVMWRHPAILAPFSGLEGPYVCLRYLGEIMLETMMIMIGDKMIIVMIRIISREVSDGSSEIGFDLWSLCDHWSGWDQVRSHKDQVWSRWDQMRSRWELWRWWWLTWVQASPFQPEWLSFCPSRRARCRPPCTEPARRGISGRSRPGLLKLFWVETLLQHPHWGVGGDFVETWRKKTFPNPLLQTIFLIFPSYISFSTSNLVYISFESVLDQHSLGHTKRGPWLKWAAKKKIWLLRLSLFLLEIGFKYMQ